MSRLVVMSLAVVVLACSERPLQPELVEALGAPSLQVSVDVRRPSSFVREPDGYSAAAVAGVGKRLGERLASLVVAEGDRPSVRLVPRAGPASFATWGPGVAFGDAVVYGGANGAAAHVLKVDARGVKDDIVLSRSLGASLQFEWALELGEGLTARREEQGSISIEANGASRFRIPAPIVKTLRGSRADLARLTLEGQRLVLEVHGLDSLEYPLTIDPSIIVTTSAEFAAGNLEDSFNVTAGALQRPLIGVGLGAVTTSAVSLASARSGLDAVQGNGFVYVTGGLAAGGTTLGEVAFAPVAADGSVGAFTQSPNQINQRYAHASVVYNGTLYVIGGTVWGGGNLFSIQMSKLGATGSPGAFTSTTNLPGARYGLCAAAWNGFLYVAGGNGTSIFSDVQVARFNPDGTLGSFSPTTPLPRATHSHACVVAGGRFYLVGGYDLAGQGSVGGSVHSAPINADGSLGAFVATASVPGRSGHRAVVMNGALYVLGGQRSGSSVGDVAGTINADGSISAFGPVSAISGGRRDFAAIASQNTLTVIGGTDGTTAMASLASAPFLSSLLTNQFETSAFSFPSPRADHAAFFYRGQLYVVGGFGTAPIGTVEASPWLESAGFGAFSTFPLATSRYRHSANAANGWMYVVAGLSTPAVPQVNIAAAAFDLDGGVMQFRDDFAALPEARADHTSEIYQSNLYVIGGLGGASLAPRDTVLRAPIGHSGNIGAFTTTTALPSPRWDHASLIHGNRLYVVGGAIDAGVTAEVLVAEVNSDGSLGAFTATTPLPAPRRGHTALAASGFLQVMQGQDAVGTAQGNSFTAPFLADGGLGAFVSMPTPGIARQGHASAVFGTQTFVIGGRAPAVSANAATATVAGLGSMGPFPTGIAPVFDATGRAALAAVAHDGVLYVLGGNTSSGRPTTIRQATIGADGSLGAFTTSSTNLPGAREGLAATVFRDRLYIAGGFDGSLNQNTVFFAPINPDHTIGAFTQATSTFLFGRNRLALVAAQGGLYVIGGTTGSPRADVQRAPINADGTLGTFSSLGTMTQARTAHAAVVNDGWLYVIGGSTGTSTLSSVEAAPINSNGTLGAFSVRGSMADARSEHVAFVEGGHLFVVGGNIGVSTDDVLVAPLLANGGLGSFRSVTRLPVVRRDAAVAVWGGRAFVVGGLSPSGSFLADVQVAPLLTTPARSSYSRLFDLGGPARVSSLSINATGGLVRVRTSTAAVTGSFSSIVDRGVADAGTPLPVAATNTRYVWAQLSVDDTANQVVTPDVAFRQVTDLTLVWDPNPVLAPTMASVPPRGTVSFTCSGGSGSGYTFTLAPGSTATIGPSGVYQAGPNASPVLGMLDVVECTDSAGVVETANVLVGPGISIFPGAVTIAPRGSVQLSADGGSRAGFLWSLTTAASGGAIDGGTGFYVAGPTANVADQVQVVDSLGNTATLSIAVGASLSITPAAVTVPPRGRATFAADGGGGGFTWSLVTNGSDGGLDGGDYVAGSLGNTTDAVRVTDRFGSVATAVVTVGAPVAVAPAAVSVVPRGAQQFSATGGADGGYVFSLGANPSGGSISAAGAYVAGSTGSVVDTVVATDTLGNVGTTSVSVGPGVSVSPATPTTTPLGLLSFSAMGGSGMGYSFSFVTNASGGTLSSSGSYRAGAGSPNDAGVIAVRDRVQVVDSLGNTFAFDVEVTNAIALTPRAVSIPPRGAVDLVATGGSMPYVWSVMTNRSGGALDAGVSTARYTAGNLGSVVDEVRVVDSLGSPFVATITVTAPLTVVAPQQSTTPRGTLGFMAQGGSGTGITWALATNASGGSITATGVYVAGATGSVTDVVQATDSLGNVATLDVAVGPAITILPAMTSVTPRGSQAFTATGGSNSGFTWSLVNRSGGTIEPFTGQYTAGATGAVTDVVGVRDSLGNTATVDVQVSSALTIMPASPRTPPRGSLTFSVQGGAPPYRWELETNNSGGSIDAGQYRAGPTPLMSDVVKVTDGLMNSKSITVVVTGGVSVTPSDPTVGPGGALTFTASGGSETGFVWSLSTNGSGGSISAEGAYVAGATGATLDQVQVVDSLGNVGLASVSVVAGGAVNQVPFEQRAPVSGWSCGCNSSSSGAGWLLAVGALFALRRRRAQVAVVSMALLVSLPGLAAPAAKKKKGPAPVVAPVAPVAPPPVAEPPPVVAPTPAPPAKPERISVAVLDVDVTVPQEKLDASAFSEMLVNSIDGAGVFRVISSKEIVTLIGLERQRQLMGCNEDTSCMAEIASALGSDLVASATVGKVGSTYLVSVRLIDGRSSRTVARANAEANDANLLLRAVWTSSQEMLDKYGATLPPDQAAKWANRPKQSAPAQLVAVDATPNFFGVSAGVVGGLQVLSEAGKRGSIGAEVDGTFRRGAFDASVGLIIGPNLGVRVAATWALLASRFRLAVGLRGAGYPGLGLWGGGPVTTAEFTIVSVWSVFAAGAAEFYPAPGTPVVVLLGTLGTAVRF